MGFVLGCPAGYARYRLVPLQPAEAAGDRRVRRGSFDHPHTALSWPLIRRLQPNAKLVLDAHNVEAEIIERVPINLRAGSGPRCAGRPRASASWRVSWRGS